MVTIEKRALSRMRIALDEMVIDGIKTNIPLHEDLVRDPGFQEGWRQYSLS